MTTVDRRCVIDHLHTPRSNTERVFDRLKSVKIIASWRGPHNANLQVADEISLEITEF